MMIRNGWHSSGVSCAHFEKFFPFFESAIRLRPEIARNGGGITNHKDFFGVQRSFSISRPVT